MSCLQMQLVFLFKLASLISVAVIVVFEIIFLLAIFRFFLYSIRVFLGYCLQCSFRYFLEATINFFFDFSIVSIRLASIFIGLLNLDNSCTLLPSIFSKLLILYSLVYFLGSSVQQEICFWSSNMYLLWLSIRHSFLDSESKF